MKKILLIVISIITLAFAIPAGAVPILLAEIDGSTTHNHSSSALHLAVPTNFVFLFGSAPFTFGPGDKPYGLNTDLLIGTETQWGIGESGTFDFNAGNSPDFLQIASRLTNGVQEDLGNGSLLLFDDTYPYYPGFAGGYGWGPEGGRLGTGTNQDLFGSSIDFIRLIVSDSSVQMTDLGTQNHPYTRLEFSTTARWEIWGSPINQPVPEPATMLLLGLGLVGIAGFRKKFQK